MALRNSAVASTVQVEKQLQAPNILNRVFARGALVASFASAVGSNGRRRAEGP